MTIGLGKQHCVVVDCIRELHAALPPVAIDCNHVQGSEALEEGSSVARTLPSCRYDRLAISCRKLPIGCTCLQLVMPLLGSVRFGSEHLFTEPRTERRTEPEPGVRRSERPGICRIA